MQPARPSAIGTTTMGGYLQPTIPAAIGAYTQPTAPGGMNLLRPTGPRTNPNNLLAGGRVIEERVVDINELMAVGRLVEAPIERGPAFRPSAPMISGLAA